MKYFKLAPFLMSLVGLFLYAALPLFMTFMETKESNVWVPINDQYKLCGDDSAYGASLKEVREDFFNFNNSVSSHLPPDPISIGKAGTNRLAAAMSYFIDSDRLAYVVSFVGGILITFLSFYIFCLILGLKMAPAALAALTYLLYLKIYSPNLDRWGLEHIQLYLFNQSGGAFFEFVNDHFRLLFLQTCMIFAWLFFIAVARWPALNPSVGRKFFWLSLFIFAVAMIPYTYVALTGFLGLYLLLFALSLLVWHPESRKMIVVCAILTLALLCSFNFVNHVLELFNFSDSRIVEEFIQDRHFSWVWLAGVLFNQHNLVTFFLYLLYRKKRYGYVFHLLFVTTLCFSLLKLYPLFEAPIDRMFNRGVGSIIFGFVCFAIFDFLDRLLRRMQIQKASFLYYSIWTSLVIAALSLPLLGAVKMGHQLTREQSYEMSVYRWQAYEYFNKNSDNKANVLTLNFADTQLLPIYTSMDMVVAFPPHQTSRIDFAVQLENYLAGWKFLNLSEDLFDSWVRNYKSQRALFQCAPKLEREPLDKLIGWLSLNTFIQDPYVKYIRDVPIRGDDGDLSKDMQKWLKNRVRQPASPEFIDSIDYVLLSSVESRWANESVESIPNFELVYENQEYKIFKKR